MKDLAVERGAAALRAYALMHGDADAKTLYVDLLTDLKHWAVKKIKDVDLWEVDEQARENFNENVYVENHGKEKVHA